MNNLLTKLFLTALLCFSVLIIAQNFLIKDKGITDKKEIREKPSEEEKTKEEKARTVGERLQYEYDLQKNPKTGKIPEGVKELELKAAMKVPIFRGSGSLEKGASDFTITPRGPGNLGGRTRSIRFDVRNANIMLAGGVSSGVFRSTDGGTTWVKVSPNDQIHNVTSLAQDTRAGQEDTWYYGTGELEASTSLGDAGYKGFGIWKSTDNGVTWTALTATQTGTLEGGDNPFDFVHRIVVDPTNGTVYAAATDVIQRSTDGGTTWEQVLGIFNFDVYSDIAVTSTGRLYAAFDGTSDSDGVWTSTTGANGSWTKIAGTGSATTPAGWNTVDNYGRIVIAIAPSSENILYVLYDNKTVSDCAGTPAPEADFYKWNQTTTTWTNLSANLPDEPGCDIGNDPFSHQGGYDLTIVVNPANANLVFIGGTNIYRSTNGFSSTAGTTRIGGYLNANGAAQYNVGGVTHHSDIHEIVFAPGNNDIVYTGTDGGIHKADITVTPVEWTSLNNSYVTYQYYYVDINPTTGNSLVVGGAQDNGTTSISTGMTAKSIGGGDGVAVGCISGTDTDNQNVLYGSQNGDISRSVFTAGVEDYFDIKPAGSTSLFVTYFHLDQDNTNYLYYASEGNLYRTRIASTIEDGTVTNNSATGWQNLTGVGTATTGDIQSMSTSRNGAFAGSTYSATDTNRKLFIGTSDGKVFRLNNPAFSTAATAPVNITPAGGSGVVSSISVNPENDNEVLITYSNYGIINVYHTTNANAASPTWTNVEGSTTAVQLASIRSSSIVKGATSTYYLIGTSTGLYCTSTLSGATTVWERVGPNDIGYAVASHIRLRASDNNLVVGTHGNGMFQLVLVTPTCTDGIQNGDETGVDCGGSCPNACPTCTDGIQNGDETGVDCGGSCPTACPTCTDGIQNGDETGVDCGGSCPTACPTCTDGIQNGDETGVDCGGSCPTACPTCTDGIQNGDETGIDCGGSCVSICPTCTDGIQNGTETGVDCGGSCPTACPTCSDGLQNGDETGVDCGGSCPAVCPDPTCTDGIQNGDETGADCGGTDCVACISITVNNVIGLSSANPAATGSIIVTVTSANANCGTLTYSWTGPGAYTASTKNATGITVAGDYILTVTDCDGNVATIMVKVPVRPRGRGRKTNFRETTILTATPNPFANQTVISFELITEEQVSVDVFDIRGVKVATLFDGQVEAGQSYEIQFGNEMPSGTYIARLTTAEGDVQFVKLFLTK